LLTLAQTFLKFSGWCYERAANGPGAGEVVVEHRLLCGGEWFNARVITADWRKSDVTRVLCPSPFELFVTSRPFDAYPQDSACDSGSTIRPRSRKPSGHRSGRRSCRTTRS